MKQRGISLWPLFLFAMVSSVWAQQVRTPTSANGNGGWTSAANIEGFGDSQSAYWSGNPGDSSVALVGQGFGFSIPGNATVTGVKLEIGRWAVPPPTQPQGATVTDEGVYLLNANGNQIGSNKRNPANWPGGDTVAVYGGNGDLWGLTTQVLNPSTINSSRFGASLVVGIAGPVDYKTATAHVDGYRITVYYTTP